MKVYFNNRKLERACSSKRAAAKAWGAENGKKAIQRLVELRAAEKLSHLSRVPQMRCHQLKGRRAGQFTVDVKHPFRLIFKPAHDPVPLKPDGGIDWDQVSAITILSIEDYHG